MVPMQILPMLMMKMCTLLYSLWTLEAVKPSRRTQSGEGIWLRTREEKNGAGCASKTKSCRRCLTEAGASACTNHGPHCWSKASRGRRSKRSPQWAFRGALRGNSAFLCVSVRRVEGRTWYTSHRGRLWIAAAAKKPTPQEIAEVEAMYRHIHKRGTHTAAITGSDLIWL